MRNLVSQKWIFIVIAGMLLILAACTGPAGQTPAPATATAAPEVTPEPEDPPSTKTVGIMKNGRGVACTQSKTLTAEHLKFLKDNGITFVKVHVPYPLDAQGNPANNYVAIKKLVRDIVAAGLEPVCQSFTPGGNAYNSSTGKIEWISYLPNVFEGYDDEYFYKVLSAGTKYIAKDLKDYCNYWIVSNEPNLSVYTGPMTTAQIVRFIDTCAKGLKEGNPDAQCGVNIFGAANLNESMRLTGKLYGEDSSLDWLGLDSYFGTLVPGAPEDWDDYIETFYNIANKPILITEFSYSSYQFDPSLVHNDRGLSYNSPVCRDKKFSFEWTGHERNEETQAEYAKTCLELFAKHPEVMGCCWFSNIDKDGPCWECGDPGCPMESSWGLTHSDGTAKPVLQVFAEFAGK